MIRSDELDAFVREGLSRYPQARDAVEEFRHQVQDRLATAFEDKAPNWVNFTAKRGGRGRGKAISVGEWANATECQIWSAQGAENDAQGWVDLGLWWGSACCREGVVLFCSRWLPDYKLQSVRLDEPKPNVRCGPVDRKQPRLYVILDANADLNELARLLLDEMDRALGKEATP